ncbi:MAG: glycosyltransferase family 39 protein [Planctomycetes bacterium]|nr:glycosyltransferase family 39 protein [Planctomycetota bacterium]
MSGEIEAVDEWLRARRVAVGLLIVLGALTLRLSVYFELRGGPCLLQHRWVESDMHFFDEWAKGLAAGDWLNRAAPHPTLDWRRTIAGRYFREYPDDPWTREAAAAPDPAAAIWNRWYGPGVFHQEPLYPYAIAVTYALAGPDPRFVFAWQMLLGVLSGLLVWRIGSRALGETGGLAAAVLFLGCAPILMYEFLLLRTALITFESVLLLWLALRACESRAPGRWCALGLVFGLALLTNSTFVLVAPLLALAYAWRERAAWKPALSRFTLFAGSALLALSPAFVRNAIVGAPLTSTSSVGALAFVCANTADFEPQAGFVADSRYLTGILHESRDKLSAVVAPTLATHSGVGSWLRQLGSKFRWTWSWYEMPNNENLYVLGSYSRALRWLPFGFGIVAPLAVLGLLLGLRRFVALAPLYALAFAAFTPLVSFYVLSRFRAPWIALLVPFAALALLECACALRTRAWTKLGPCALVLLVAGWFVNQPLPRGMPRIRPADWSAPFRTWYVPEAQAALEAKDWTRAAALLEEAVAHQPPFVAQLGHAAGQRLPRPDERAWVVLSAQLHQNLARAQEQLGRLAESVPNEVRAEELQALVQ